MSEEKEFYPKYNGFKLDELAAAQVEIKSKIEGLKSQQSVLQKEFDHLRLHRIPAMMDEMGIDSVNLTGIGRLSTQGALQASIIKDMRDEAYEWLENNGHGDLIKGTVNSSSLKALIKEQIKAGEQFPEELFNIHLFTMATVTKG